MATFDINDIKRRMDGAIKSLQTELSGLRTGRASASLLEPVMVEAYGSSMPLNQVATVSVPEARLITVQVWDRGMSAAVEKAIQSAGLGLNPMSEGQLIRVPIPDLSQERRTELTKVAGKYAESAKVSVRNVRRDGMDALKKMEKDGDISQDEHKRFETDIQKATDQFVAKIDEMLVHKEKDIMQV